MPTLLSRCDHIRVYNGCMALWPYAFFLLPLLNIIARTGFPNQSGSDLVLEDADGRVQAMVWCGIAALLSITRVACVAFSCVSHFEDGLAHFSNTSMGRWGLV